MTLARRPVLLSALALIGVGAVGVWQVPKLLRPRLHTPYDDLTGAIEDHDAAILVGDAVLKGMGGFVALDTARVLRARAMSLEEMARRDAADGALIEAEGWVLPRSLALSCALLADHAARINPRKELPK